MSQSHSQSHSHSQSQAHSQAQAHSQSHSQAHSQAHSQSHSQMIKNSPTALKYFFLYYWRRLLLFGYFILVATYKSTFLYPGCKQIIHKKELLTPISKMVGVIFYPTLPSISKLISLFNSRAYSSGNSLATGSIKPETINDTASFSDSPRERR